jgi:cell division protein FtsN
MGNSILSALPSLHGTMLSVIGAIFIAYAIFAFQQTVTAKEELNFLKRQVQNISHPFFEVKSAN